MDIEFKCSICESRMYITDHCYREVILHCSSDEARFWDYNRGSKDQMDAKEHWDKSILEVYKNEEI